MSKPLRILFLCVANSARSQLAEGLAKSIFSNKAIIESAGSNPSGEVQPLAIEVLREEGIDISKNWSKSYEELSPEFINNLDYVITLCAEEACPAVITKAQKLHWPIPDPAGAIGSKEEQRKKFQEAKEMIKSRLIDFFKLTN